MRYIDDTEFIEAIVANPDEDETWRDYGRFLVENELYDVGEWVRYDFDIIRRCIGGPIERLLDLRNMAKRISPLAVQIMDRLTTPLRQPLVNLTRRVPPLPHGNLDPESTLSLASLN